MRLKIYGKLFNLEKGLSLISIMYKEQWRCVSVDLVGGGSKG